uniref:Uncharacterized protein n=1 Tax=Arundo donax TaxID=35708 RepID=A0A0A9BCE1_ARUDO
MCCASICALYRLSCRPTRKGQHRNPLFEQETQREAAGRIERGPVELLATPCSHTLRVIQPSSRSPV